MADKVKVRGRDYKVGRLEGEPTKGSPCGYKFGAELCKKTQSPHYCEPRVKFIEAGLSKLRHSEAPDGFQPLKWQREWVIEPLFGIVVWDATWEQWVRRYRVVWCSVPRKQGKSMLVAALTALMLRTLPLNSAMLLGAQKLDEAVEVVGGHTRDFIESTPKWKHDITWKSSTLEFRSNKTGASCRVVAVNRPESARGGMWAWSVLDEIAFYRDPEESLAVIRSSWGSVREPVVLCITTLPGDAGSWGRTNNVFMSEVLSNPDLAPDTLPVISMVADTEDWKSEETWKRVCPALAEGVQSMTDFRLLAKQSETNPSVRSKFMTERLNAPAVTDAAFIPVDVWNAQKKQMTRAELYERITELPGGVYAGADFSRVSDFTSIALVAGVGEHLYIWQQSWIPEPVAAKLDNKLSGRITQWLDEGYLRILPEGANSGYVAEALTAIIQGCKGQVMVGYDIHEAEDARKHWETEGVSFEACPQGRVLSPSIKAVSDMAFAGLLIHGDDPVLEYAVSCAEVKITEQEKYMLRKPDRNISASRIDPIIAVLTAFQTRARNQEPGGEWVGRLI